MSSIISSFPPFSLTLHTALLSETHLAYLIVFPLGLYHVVQPSITSLSRPLIIMRKNCNVILINLIKWHAKHIHIVFCVPSNLHLTAEALWPIERDNIQVSSTNAWSHRRTSAPTSTSSGFCVSEIGPTVEWRLPSAQVGTWTYFIFPGLASFGLLTAWRFQVIFDLLESTT